MNKEIVLIDAGTGNLRSVSQFKLGDAAAYSHAPQGAAYGGVAAAPARSVANERKPLRLG